MTLKNIKRRSASKATRNRSDLGVATVEVSNSGAPGSLIGALYSSDNATGVNYDVPLRDSGPVRTMTGSYPWKIDDDFTTIVYITNISDGPAGFVGEINYDGGKYLVDPRMLAAGETAVFDMRKVIEEQKPDGLKRSLPHNASSGQFKWAIRGVTGGKITLIGRAEMVSRSQRISASYSCNDPCPPTYGGSITPVSMEGVVGYVESMSAWETTYYNSGYYIGPYPMGATWSVDNPIIASITPTGNYSTATCTALSAGLANIHAFFGTFSMYTWDGLECLDDNNFYDVTADSGMTVFCPLCTACGSPGMACAENGQCKTGRDLIPEICNQLGITYANQQTPRCSGGNCGAIILYDITRVTHSCASVSLGGANLTETITTDNGCSPGPVQTGQGCAIQNDNTLLGISPSGPCVDAYGICLPASSYPSGGCTEVYTQNIFVGNCLAETRTITFRITKTATSCSGTATRN